MIRIAIRVNISVGTCPFTRKSRTGLVLFDEENASQVGQTVSGCMLPAPGYSYIYIHIYVYIYMYVYICIYIYIYVYCSWDNLTGTFTKF